MKISPILLIIFCFLINSFAQTDLEKLVATEKTFAQTAAEKNTKTAFLEFTADDSVVFNPNPVNTKEFWNSRQANSSLLAWNPEFADISANGAIGYTTGPWEFRPKGKDDKPVAFGHFVTIWQKQPNGNYRFVLDFGINHPQIALVDKWTSPTTSTQGKSELKPADAARQFFETAEKKGFDKAYKEFAADDIRFYRQDKMPFIGKKNALDEIKKNSARIKASPRSIFVSAQDLAYLSSSYSTFDKNGKELEQGNFLQIWKLRQGQWQIVLDLFKANPKQ